MRSTDVVLVFFLFVLTDIRVVIERLEDMS